MELNLNSSLEVKDNYIQIKRKDITKNIEDAFVSNSYPTLVSDTSDIIVVPGEVGGKQLLLPDESDYLFKGCNARVIDLSNVKDVSNVTSLYLAFKDCKNLEYVIMPECPWSNVWSMQGLFEGCSALKRVDLYLGSVSVLSEAVDMCLGCTNLKEFSVDEPTYFKATHQMKWGHMFEGCSNLERVFINCSGSNKEIYPIAMFYGCSSLQQINLGELKIAEDACIQNIFTGCKSLDKDSVIIKDDRVQRKLNPMGPKYNHGFKMSFDRGTIRNVLFNKRKDKSNEV